MALLHGRVQADFGRVDIHLDQPGIRPKARRCQMTIHVIRARADDHQEVSRAERRRAAARGSSWSSEDLDLEGSCKTECRELDEAPEFLPGLDQRIPLPLII